MKYINIILALILLCTVFLINKENIGTWIAVLFAAVVRENLVLHN